MAYTADTILHCKCDALPLLESASGTLLSTLSDGVGSGSIVDGVIDYGLQLVQSEFYVISTTGTSSAFTIGFWLKSVNPGIVTSPAGQTESLRMPVCARSIFIYNSTTTQTTSNATFIVHEETQTDGTNRLVVHVGDNATVTSSSYSVGQFRHFWITFDGSIPKCRIFIDLVEDLGTTVSGTLPTSALPNRPFSINRTTVGSAYQIARNEGAIDDIIVFSTAKNDAATISRAANLGAKFVADTAYTNVEEIDQPILFDDVSTVQVNAVYANKGNVYVARSDGKLLKGTRLLWQSRREFNKSSELSGLTILKTADNGSASIENGALKLINETIRI